jgi:putative nucleotidyltransferase with HDIG domain
VTVQSDGILKLLQQVPFLEPLTPQQRAAVASGAVLREYGPGTDIVREGSRGEGIFIIESGQVIVYKQLNGEVIELARLDTGDFFFGEIALLEDAPRSASVRADTQVRVLEIPRSGFNHLLAENPDIALAVMRTLSRRLRETDQRMIEDLLRKNKELRLAHCRLEESYDTTLIALSNALDLRDAATEGHSIRVAEMAVQIGQQMGLSERQLEALRLGSLLHDVGKIGIPDAILRKPGELSSEEWETMRRHSVWGAKILDHIDFLAEALPLVRHHHEAWSKSGYPDGLCGEEIPLLARIFAVADAYDAITSDRPYRKARSPKEALAIIREEAGHQFDPAVVAAFEEVFQTIYQERQPEVS